MRQSDKVNILLVDDHRPKLLTYEAMLNDLGENLIKASSSREALEQLLKNDVAVILMDVNMPEMSGFEIAEIIRQHPRFHDVAIIFISALHLTDMDRLKGYQRGAVDYISVPIIPEVLRAKVAVFVDLYRKTKQLERLNRELEQRVRERTEKLWESEGQFRTLANSIPQLAWMATPDGSRFWHNQRWYDYTGASPEQMDGDGWLTYHHPGHVDRIVAGLRQSQESGAEWEDIHPVRGRQGEYRWFLSRAVPILDSQRQIVRWFGTATDITGQIEAEERIRVLNRALKQQIDELKTVMQVLPVGVRVTQDLEGKTTSGNPALYEMFGMQPGEDFSEREPWSFEVFHNGDPVPPDRMPTQRALQTKNAVGPLELEIRRPDGRVVHAIVNAIPFFDDIGQVRGAVAAYIDISERRAMEKLLRERAELIDLAPEAIIVRDEDGVIRYWNSGAETLYGWKRDEVLNRHMHYTLATRFPVPYAEIEAALEEKGNWEGNLIQTTKDGHDVTVACRKTRKSEDGTSRDVLEINRDITDELRLQEMLRRTDKLAAMGRAAGMIAHEINNPLEAIINALFLLHHHPSLDQDARRFARIANEELVRLARITRQTLSFYRESQEAVPVSVTDLLEDIVSLHENHAKKKGIALEMKVHSDRIILGFPGELKQVFLNLVDNAMHAMPDGGQLRIHVCDSHEYASQRAGIRIFISDTGIGVQPEHSENIFEPFFTTKSTKGTGLGLWISRGIVHKYEGTIRFRTLRCSHRTMTSFSVFFPALQTPQNGPLSESKDEADIRQTSLWGSPAS